MRFAYVCAYRTSERADERASRRAIQETLGRCSLSSSVFFSFRNMNMLHHFLVAHARCGIVAVYRVWCLWKELD